MNFLLGETFLESFQLVILVDVLVWNSIILQQLIQLSLCTACVYWTVHGEIHTLASSSSVMSLSPILEVEEGGRKGSSSGPSPLSFPEVAKTLLRLLPLLSVWGEPLERRDGLKLPLLLLCLL